MCQINDACTRPGVRIVDQVRDGEHGVRSLYACEECAEGYELYRLWNGRETKGKEKGDAGRKAA